MADKDGRERTGLAKSGEDVIQLVIAYVRQETLTPLRGLGRFLVFGIVGSIALCLGVILLLIGLLRLLQTETGSTFAGHLSWLPYTLVAVVALGLIGLATWRIGAGQAARRRPTPERRRG